MTPFKGRHFQRELSCGRYAGTVNTASAILIFSAGFKPKTSFRFSEPWSYSEIVHIIDATILTDWFIMM